MGYGQTGQHLFMSILAAEEDANKRRILMVTAPTPSVAIRRRYLIPTLAFQTSTKQGKPTSAITVDMCA